MRPSSILLCSAFLFVSLLSNPLFAFVVPQQNNAGLRKTQALHQTPTDVEALRAAAAKAREEAAALEKV